MTPHNLDNSRHNGSGYCISIILGKHGSWLGSGCCELVTRHASKPRPSGKAKGTAARGLGKSVLVGPGDRAGLRCLLPRPRCYPLAGRGLVAPMRPGAEGRKARGDSSVAAAPAAELDPSWPAPLGRLCYVPSGKITARHGGGFPKRRFVIPYGIMYGLRHGSDQPCRLSICQAGYSSNRKRRKNLEIFRYRSHWAFPDET